MQREIPIPTFLLKGRRSNPSHPPLQNEGEIPPIPPFYKGGLEGI